MSNETPQDVFSAIKNDDVKLFSRCLDEKKSVLSLCFGRFPVLSLCYLYKSKKIIKMYGKRLEKISSYTFIDEPYEAYEKFLPLAKKCVKLYTIADNIVSPLEMLAILKDSDYLEEVYPAQQKNQKIMDNISEIYSLNHGLAISLTNDRISTGKKKLSKFKKIMTYAIIAVTVIMAALPLSAWAALRNSFGTGTEQNPYVISSAAGLQSIKDIQGKYFVLSEDITLPQSWGAVDFSGTLDGKGKTIYVSDKLNGPFIGKLSGCLKNVNFVFDEIETEISDNTAFVVSENKGLIDNVNVSLDLKLEAFSRNKDLYVSCFVLENSGNILNSSVDAEVSFGGGEPNGYDVFLAGIASYNAGKISGCSLTDGSKFETETVDVSAIVTENAQNGVIENCVNNADVSQITSFITWAPNTGGIVLINSGTVSGCKNNGNITSLSDAVSSEYISNVFAAGIACNNSGTIENCENNGVITAASKQCVINAGGIAADNYGTIRKSKNAADVDASSERAAIYAGGVAAGNYGEINNSCSYGEINAASSELTMNNGVILFLGGIAGLSSGRIKDSYSAVTFNTPNGNAVLAENSITGGNAFIGGIVGSGAVVVMGGNAYIVSVLENNYYVSRNNISQGAATALSVDSNNNIKFYIVTETGTTAVASVDELRGKGVYWG